MISLDAIDRRILDRLQKDGRLSNAELAERVGLSASPCWRRVKALEEAGVIKGYAAQVPPLVERHGDRRARAEGRGERRAEGPSPGDRQGNPGPA